MTKKVLELRLRRAVHICGQSMEHTLLCPLQRLVQSYWERNSATKLTTIGFLQELLTDSCCPCGETAYSMFITAFSQPPCSMASLVV